MTSLPVYVTQNQYNIYKQGIPSDNIVGDINQDNLPETVTLQTNTFNQPGKLLKIENNGKIGDNLLSSNVTLGGNNFNTANNLPKLDNVGKLNLSVLPDSVTTQGNSFNASGKLVKLDNCGLYPNINGRNILRPVGSWTWVNNYINLINNQDNVMRFDTEEINTDPDTFTIQNIGTNTCYIHIKRPGIYKFNTEIHLYDLYNNVDITVKIRRSDVCCYSPVDMRGVSDSRFDENSADQLILGSSIIKEDTEGFYDITVNPSSNAPFLSSRFNAPTRLSIEKI